MPRARAPEGPWQFGRVVAGRPPYRGRLVAAPSRPRLFCRETLASQEPVTSEGCHCTITDDRQSEAAPRRNEDPEHFEDSLAFEHPQACLRPGVQTSSHSSGEDPNIRSSRERASAGRAGHEGIEGTKIRAEEQGRATGRLADDHRISIGRAIRRWSTQVNTQQGLPKKRRHLTVATPGTALFEDPDDFEGSIEHRARKFPGTYIERGDVERSRHPQ
jgi:hypothetical protein